MGKLAAASKKVGPGSFPGHANMSGSPKPQAPSTYPEDDPGSGAGYLGTAPAPPAKKGFSKKVHAPGKRGKW